MSEAQKFKKPNWLYVDILAEGRPMQLQQGNAPQEPQPAPRFEKGAVNAFLVTRVAELGEEDKFYGFDWADVGPLCVIDGATVVKGTLRQLLKRIEEIFKEEEDFTT